MKKAMSLLLALVMCIGLGVPAFAHPVEALDTNAAVSVESPQYAVYKKSYSQYMGCLTYVNMTFTISERGGTPAFESLDSFSFTPMDSTSLHMKLVSYTYQLSSTKCTVYASREEMLGDTPTGYKDTTTFVISIDSLVGNASESGPSIASSVSVVVGETYGIRMTAEEINRQVATSGIGSVTRVPMRRAD